MITLILSIITGIISILIALAVLFRDYRRLTNVAFFTGIIFTIVAIVGDSMCVLRPGSLTFWKRIVFIGEATMAPSFLLFTLSFARTDYWGSVSRFSRLLLFLFPALVVLSVVAPIESFFYSPEFESESVLFLGNAGYIFNLLLLLYFIVALVNIETTLKSSSGPGRWQLKYTLIGTGGIIAINIFYYSYALLYRSINMSLLPVRSGAILISVLLIGFSLMRHKPLDVEVAVSRRVVYKSLGIIIVGFYLLGLGIMGEGMRYFGPRVGKNITTFLGFVGAILVLTIVLSEQLRRKVMVVINKNFFSHKYDYREQWLQFTQRLSMKHSFEELLDAIAEGFKEAIGSKGASVWLKEEGNGEYVCARAFETLLIKDRPGKEIVEFLRNKQWVLNAHDGSCKTVVDFNSDFILKNRASLIVPLLYLDRLVGFIILREGLAGDEYNYEDYDLLKTLARQATLAIMNAQMSKELTEAREMEAMGRLSSFIIHDLKNAASGLSLIAQNAEEHIDNPEFQRDAMRAVSNTSGKIKGIIGKLKNLPLKKSLALQYSDLGECVMAAIGELNLNGDHRLHYDAASGPVMTKFDREEIMKVVVNLIINALDATSSNRRIKVSVGKEGDMAFVKVSDNGNGMSEEFIEQRLFKPFQTTKSKGLGIGLYQCKTIVEAHSGKLRVFSQEGKGTDFIVNLPVMTD
ncbi:MAG: PEP-CTERM system histidine kinase PrsK [Nitrospiraceae bacterium]|nr:MAG: PEP-CTERM system histidine kinase PrsK [Nitrospiraceae bacterium]